MSPASRTYLDLKYDESTRLGTTWAGYVGVRDAYEWDPGDVLGVEAAVWTETLQTLADVEFMAFPRLLALAEVASSPAEQRDWQDFGKRLAEHEPATRGARRELLPVTGDPVARRVVPSSHVPSPGLGT